MAHTFSVAEKASLNQAVSLLTKGTAPELVYPSGVHEEVAQLIGDAANSSGYLTRGAFKTAIGIAPISTLLMFIKFVGVSNTNLQHAIDLLVLGQSEELPLDATVNQFISLAHGSYSTQLALQQNLQDKPLSTLLGLLVYSGT